MFHCQTSSQVIQNGIEIKFKSKAGAKQKNKNAENQDPDQESLVQLYLTLCNGQHLRLLSSKYPLQNSASSRKAQKAV